MLEITEQVRELARERASGRCECTGSACRHHLAGARCKRGLRGEEWKVYWKSERGGTARGNLDAWCLECFANNFTVPTTTVTILRSGIFGYDELEGDELRRASTLKAVLRDAAARVARAKKGRLVENDADDVWLEFSKSSRAVAAALDLQPRFHKRARKLKLSTPALCSGIHRGEVVRSRSGVLVGEAVSVAAKVKACAHSGQIVISRTAAEELGRRVKLDPLGDHTFEELPQPLSCWVVQP
jgi:class 3 adenylate cyclase